MSGIFFHSGAKADKPPGTAIEPLLEEMKRQYDRTWEIKSSLEGRANNIIAVSSTVATLLFGFGTFAIQNLNASFSLMTAFVFLLALGIGASVVAVLLLVLLFRVEEHGVPIKPESLQEIKNGKTALDLFIQANKEKFYVTMIKVYVEQIKSNAANNEKKATRLVIGLWIFFSGMVTVPLLLAVILYAVSIKEFNIAFFK